MSDSAHTGRPLAFAQPGLRTKLAAIVVVVALAVVAAFALFAPPTQVPAGAPQKAAPAVTAPAPTAPEEEGGERGD